tara:strand:- start:12170 stop:13213 length:1044 start_codon:yes stop_codon:yes gene_type:complete
MDMDARMQLFDLKTIYKFQTTPGIDRYNMPLYSTQTQPGAQDIASYPVYQGFLGPCFVNGISVPFYTQRETYFNQWPNYTQQLNVAAVGDGTAGPYTLSLPYFPAIPGHVDMAGIIATRSTQDPIRGTSLNLSVPVTSVNSAVYITATGADGQNIVVADSGQFLSNSTDGDLYGLLMSPGNPPFGNTALSGGYSISSNTVNYNTGVINVEFLEVIPSGTPINVQCFFYNQGLPRSILYYNNTITIRPPANIQYAVELAAYLTPAAFLDTEAAIPYAYMAEYIARGAARKILSDTGDIEQFMFYEPLFKEQEMLVWKRSQRQFTSTRTETIFSGSSIQNNTTGYGQGN